MKYGLIWFPKSVNLGDDIQSYAAIRYLPNIDYLIDREELDSFMPTNGESVAVIMNGWYLYEHYHWPPSPFLFPKILGIHFDMTFSWKYDRRLDANHVLEGYGAKYLQTHGPVGCRDQHTLAMVQKAGIDAYYSGCLTLTINKFENIDKQDYICLVDVPEPYLTQIKNTTNRPIKEITHHINRESLSYEQRIKVVEDHLKIYQGAHCVITTRLHCALPCLALETPVLLLYSDWMENRVHTYLPYLNHINVDLMDSDSLILSLYDLENPQPNPAVYMNERNALIESCEQFMNGINDHTISVSQLYADYIERARSFENYIQQDSEKLYMQIENGKILQTNLVQKEQELMQMQQQLARLNEDVCLYEEKVRICNETIISLKNEFLLQEKSLKWLRALLDDIYSSRFWKIASKYYNCVDKIRIISKKLIKK